MIEITLIFIIVCVIYSQIIGRKFLPKCKISTKIPDIGHKYIPNINSNFSYLSDFICTILLIFAIYVSKKSNKILFGKCFLLVFILRLISIYLTVLPQSKEYKCEHNTNIFTLSVQCGNDYIFSGHTAITVLSLLFIWKVYPDYLYYYVPVYMLQVFLLLGMRHHYSIDIFVGTLITYFIFDKFQK